MRLRIGLSIFLLLLTFTPAAQAAYRMAVEQLQPEMPYPGDTVVFKVTLLNEASWSSVLYAEVISPDGIIYPVSAIRTRAGITCLTPSTSRLQYQRTLCRATTRSRSGATTTSTTRRGSTSSRR